MISLPDLLHLNPRVSVDNQVIHELLEYGFLGKETGHTLEQALSEAEASHEGWNQAFFADDLFIHELVDQELTLQLDGRSYTVNSAFLARTLSDPPIDLETVQFRQAILTELDDDEGVRERVHHLYRELYQLLTMFKLPGQAARLDINSFRLDLLRQAKNVIDWMVEAFGDARSGLRRLHETGLEIQASKPYRILAALLDYEGNLSQLNVDIRIGATGRIADLKIHKIEENKSNPFYRRPWRRFWDSWRFLYYGYKWNARDVVSRLVHEVFLKISPSFTPLIQITGHLEVYLTARQFRQHARENGLAMELATFDDRPMELQGLFNPLLLDKPYPVVPNGLQPQDTRPTVIVTGPNSGGKTRMLQAVGLAQVLGQSGLYVSASSANLPLLRGMYVSLIEREAADQAEGRLGRELLRIRKMFEVMESPAMVVFDELCSGTNPSEGIEVFQLVLRLLERQEPVALISTHFLDFARELQEQPPLPRLEFLQVEVDEGQRSTYQFVPGVAQTSLAAVMAERLGVTFEELSTIVDRRQGEKGDTVKAASEQIETPAAAAVG